ncbi:MAG: hypothetical protein WC792_04940 [Candidatus Micrarchaeia archaeon]|jgi:hypothetical protein
MAGLLNDIYLGLEDSYYSAIEFLDNLGIPLIKYFVEPIESRGIPSFPVAMLGLLLLFASAFAAFSYLATPTKADLTATVYFGKNPVNFANVTLAIADGNEFLQITGKDGKAVFRNLPFGKTVQITASKPGLADLSKAVKLEEERQIVKFSMLAANQNANVSSIRVKVFDPHLVPLGEVKIEYYDLAGVLLGTKYTDALGLAKIDFDGTNAQLSLDVSKRGFSPIERQTVFFSHKEPYEIQLDPISDEADVDKAAELIVQVKNAQQQPVDAIVSVHSEETDEELQSTRTGSSGQASFLLSFGTRVYVVASPALPQDQAKYAEITRTNATTLDKASKRIEFKLNPRSANGGTIILQAIDAATSEGIAGAKLALYEGSKKEFWNEKTAGDDGKASFEVSNSTTYLATAYAPGYLPAFLPGAKNGDYKAMKLHKANASNSASVLVTVLSAKGLAEGDATAKFENAAEGISLGIPAKRTGINGTALFDGVPTGITITAVGQKGARVGRSNPFTLSPSNITTNITVKLEPGRGNVTAAIMDDVFGKRVAGIVRAINESGATLAFCNTSVETPCTLEIQAGLKFQLAAEAPGYVSSAHAGDFQTLAPEESLGTGENPVEIALVPNEFKDYLYVRLSKVYEEGDQTAAVTSLDRGKNYVAEFNVNYPSNMTGNRGGFYVQLGEDGAAAQSDFYIAGDLSYPRNDTSGIKPASINRKAEVNTERLCVDDADVSACTGDKPCKSVKIEYPAGMPTNMSVFKIPFSVRAISVSQKIEKNLTFKYRVYSHSTITESYARSPPDGYYDTDNCAVNTTSTTLPLYEGTYCDETACITVTFKNETGEYPPGFDTALDSVFTTSISVRQRKTLSGNVQLLASASPHFNFTSYSFENAGGAYTTGKQNQEILANRLVSGEFGFDAETTALHATGFSPGYIEITLSATNPEYSKAIQARINVVGDNPLKIKIEPTQLYVGEEATVTATVTNKNGVPVPGAWIDAFYDYDTPPIHVASNDSKETNAYTLGLFAPLKRGKFRVTALASPDTGTNATEITMRDFLPASKLLAPCNENAFLIIKHEKPNNYYDDSVDVSITAPAGCFAELQGAGQDISPDPQYKKYLIPGMNAGVQKNLTITPPASATSCNVTVTSSQKEGFAISHNVAYYNCKPRSDAYCEVFPEVDVGSAPLSIKVSAEFRNLPEQTGGGIPGLPSAGTAAISCGNPQQMGLPEGTPTAIADVISRQGTLPLANPPATIVQCDYDNKATYYLPPRSPTEMSSLYDADGTILCSPDGGLAGTGDGRCPNYFETRANCNAIWEDPRAQSATLSNNRAETTCNYENSGQYTASASLTLSDGQVIQCEKQITATQRELTNLPKTRFLINSTGIYALDPETKMQLSPLIPTTAAEITIKNDLPTWSNATTLAAQHADCLKAQYWNGSVIPGPFDIPPKSEFSFALSLGTTAVCPKFQSGAKGGITLGPITNKLELEIGCGTCTAVNNKAKTSITTEYKQETGEHAVTRFAKQTGTFVSNNIQQILQKTILPSKTISPSENAWIAGSVTSARISQNAQADVSFDTTSSTPQNSGTAKDATKAAYNTLLSQVNRTSAEKVLVIPKAATIYILIQDTGNGGTAASILHRYQYADYGTLTEERRCNLNPTTGKCEEPCGGKGQACCENTCFADDITTGVKEPNTRCYDSKKCTCGHLFENACTKGLDPSQPHECVNPKNVKYSDALCRPCGFLGELPCDPERQVETCEVGFANSASDQCALRSSQTDGGTAGGDGSGGGSGGGGDGFGNPCTPDDMATWCSATCITGKIPDGCDPAQIQTELQKAIDAKLADMTAELPTDFSAWVNGLDYDAFKSVAIDKTTTAQYNAWAAENGKPTIPEAKGTSYDDLLNKYYQTITTQKLDLQLQCESGVFKNGQCMTQAGQPITLNHPELCETDGNAQGGKCCWAGGKTSANVGHCCNGQYQINCKVNGVTQQVSASNCPSDCGEDSKSSCFVSNTQICA